MGRSRDSCGSSADSGQRRRAGPMRIDYHAILPEMILSGTILLVLVADSFARPRRKWVAMPVSFLGILAAFISQLTLIGSPLTTFNAMVVVDIIVLLFSVFFLSA